MHASQFTQNNAFLAGLLVYLQLINVVTTVLCYFGETNEL